MKKFLAVLLSVMVCGSAFASPFLVSDPHDQATCYEIRLIVGTPDDPANIVDDQIFTFSAQADGSLQADLVNFPTGQNNLMVLACNVFGKSVEVPFTFEKVMPGISTNMALVNIDGVAYLVTDPQEGIIQYRVRIDGIDYFYDTTDGALALDLSGLADGVHSVEIYAINIWGESNPAPFGFTTVIPIAPQNLHLIQ
jgi:hypothetical protein